MTLSMSLRALIGALFIAFLLFRPSTAQADASTELTKLIDEIWAFGLAEPFKAYAHKSGPLPTRFSDISPETIAKKQRVRKRFYERLVAIDPKALSAGERINLQLQKLDLGNTIRHYDNNLHYIPFNSDSFFFQLGFSLGRLGLDKEEDFRAYLQLLASIPKFFAQHQDNMDRGIEKQLTQPRFMASIADEALAAIINTPLEASNFFRPFNKMPKGIPVATQKQLQNEAKVIITTKVIPAYQQLRTYFKDTYFPKAKASIAATDWPDGAAIYQNEIEKFTTLSLSADAIHEIGLKEVARIRDEMQEIISAVKFEGDFKAFLHFLRTDEQFYAKSAQALLEKAAFYAKEMDGELPKLFRRLPSLPYTIKPVPASIAPNYTTGRYLHGNLERKKPGTYLLNTYALDKRPLYELQALTYHEAVPGHHLQITLAQELGSLPKFRQAMYISAFGEGWALYSEKLGKELGLYSDPYSDFGRLSYEMWRALRLVVDTGMHAKGWSRERAVKFMEDNSALSKSNIQTEVNRYITWPAQALSYKLGEIKIIELRRHAEKQLGEKFDIRAFHDKVLEQGAIPLSLLEQQIEDFTKTSRRETATR